MMRRHLAAFLATVLALLLSGMVAGCQYEARFREIVRPLSLSFAVTYADRGSEAIVTYSVPPPSPGKVYMMWAYSQGRSQVAKMGVVPAGVDQVVKGSTNFPIYGVIITEETGGNVTRMEGTGVIELTLYEENFGPSSGGTRGTPTPAPRR